MPVFDEQVYESEVEHLRDICDIFLDKEEEYCRKHAAKPWVMEASVGLEQSLGPLDSPEPVAVMLRNGQEIQVRGRLDRVDRFYIEGSERYAIWDYKSGSDVSYRSDEVFQDGRKLQPVLYVGMLRHRLEEIGEDPESVESFGYFFPSPKTEGNRISWSSFQLEPGFALLTRLCEMIRDGIFIATNNREDCTFCEYRDVCENTSRVTKDAWRIASDSSNTKLEPWRGGTQYSG